MPSSEIEKKWQLVQKDRLSHKRGLLELQDKTADIQLKGHLAHWVKYLVTAYLIFVAVILLIQLFCAKNPLSDIVLSMLLGTTTINVLGLLFILLKSLFPANPGR